jgi:hypothetical protein
MIIRIVVQLETEPPPRPAHRVPSIEKGSPSLDVPLNMGGEMLRERFREIEGLPQRWSEVLRGHGNAE